MPLSITTSAEVIMIHSLWINYLIDGILRFNLMGEKLRITDVPPGQAPEWVREQWVGLEMPIDEDAPKQEGFTVGVRGGKAENRGGYPVKTADAMHALYEKAEEGSSQAEYALSYWRSNVLVAMAPRLLFSRDVCEIVPEDKGNGKNKGKNKGK